jgi:hypothetical protein
VERRNEMDRSVSRRAGPVLRVELHRLVTLVSCATLLIGTAPAPIQAHSPSAPQPADVQRYNVEQLDALLAPIALYPDELLTQILIASTYPLQVAEAARWVEDPVTKTFTGNALPVALKPLPWDPSVKSLVPFPQVLAMMNSKVDWVRELGYAMTVQQSEVMDSIQRLRRQAQAAGRLQTTPQQVVTTQDGVIVIASAQPDVLYVPTYNPAIVYGIWPYPAYPPVYLPPPPGYDVGSEIRAALAFGVAVRIVGSLWGWATPQWGSGSVNINVNRYNYINVNQPPIDSSNWRPSGTSSRPGDGYRPPAGGPVGEPARPAGLPANSIGRLSVSVPGGLVRPPNDIGPDNHPPIGQTGINRPGGGSAASVQVHYPSGSQTVGQGKRPTGAGASRSGDRGPAAFGGVSDGRNAAQFQNRGAQSRRQASRPRGRGGARAQGAGGRPQSGGARGR